MRAEKGGSERAGLFGLLLEQDPWKEESPKSEERIEEVSDTAEEPRSEGLEDTWQTWDEG